MNSGVEGIVDGVVKCTDLNTLAPLKQKGFWKDQLKAVLDLLGSWGNPVSGVAGGAKFLLDEIDIFENYKLSEFFRKFTAFALELTDISAEERVKFSEEVQEKANDKSGNVLMGMVDRLDNINKGQVLANLIKARIHQMISVEDFFRLSSMLERIPYVDLNMLRYYKEPYYDESGDTELLYATGALNQSTINVLGHNKYILSVLGEKLLTFGLGIYVKVKRGEGTDVDLNYATVEEAEGVAKELT